MLWRVSDIIWLEPIRFGRMGHGRVVTTLGTAVGSWIASDCRARGSILASSTIRKSPIIGIYPAASVLKQVPMSPLYENILYIHMYVYDRVADLGLGMEEAIRDGITHITYIAEAVITRYDIS